MERQNAEHFDLSAGIALIRKVRASGSKTPVIIHTSSHLVDVLRDTVREAGGTAIVGTPSALYDEIEIAVGEP